MEENTNNLCKKVEELFKQSKFEEIIALLTVEELETRKNAELFAWRSIANYKLEKNVFVTMHFAKKAIAADPTYFMGYFAKACAWTDKKENDKAIADYTNAIELNPNFVDAYYNRGIAWQTIKKNDKANADYNKAIEIYDKAIANNTKNAELYLFRGNIRYNKTDYNNAIKDFSKAIENNPDFADAYYNRGLAYFTKKDYINAIKDYSKAIELKPDYADVYYYDRGNAWKAKGKYKEAINDYTAAIKIKPDFENAYYYRGLARKGKDNDSEGEKQDIDIEGSKQDFEKYLELTTDENDNGVRYAKYYLKKLDEIKDIELSEIIDLVAEIKKILRINKDSITHYTSLSAMKKLILAENSKLWISEGNFMNDSSEGTELFSFLYGEDKSIEMEKYMPKPFIGSFVPKYMNDDLNMWRFYGKEDGVEAKGCAIVLSTQEFIEDIKNSLSNEKNKEARIDDESDINFYRVVYLKHKSFNFKIPKLEKDKFEEFNNKINILKEKVTSYSGANKISLEEHLNNIAFLFKRDDYENENEVRLVMSGIEFEKKFYIENKEDKSINPPLVYIELEPIKKIVEQITLGPKVDKANEWASALHYSYKGEEKAPEIRISHLPYK